MLSGSEIYNTMANFLNNTSVGSPTRNHYRGVALVGGIVCLPIMILPLIISLMYKNKCIKSETAKVIKVMNVVEATKKESLLVE